MTTPAPFNDGRPSLKLPRRAPSDVSDAPEPSPAQAELAADLEVLREREANLREYEARLRAWQTQLDARSVEPATGSSETPFIRSLSQAPFSSDSLLASSWEKFHRARALLESEQNQMRDDRMTFREIELNLKKREAELDAREALLAQREKLVAPGKPSAEGKKKSLSTMQRLTKGPFLSSVFKAEKE